MPTTEQSHDWYDAVVGSDLEQGDILQDVLLPIIIHIDPHRPVVEFEHTSAIVLTQSCDIVNGKTTRLVLGGVTAYDRYVTAEADRGNHFVASRRFRKAVVDGHLPPLTILRPTVAGDRLFPWSLVDFRQIYTVPVVDAGELARSLGPRPRLRPPYREHLSQAFARFHMRVGLPTDAEDFERLTA
jgi:hypothetical protein